MKRKNPPTQKPSPEDLLKKLRQLDEEQIKDVRGGLAGDRCMGRCGHHCNHE
jgi:hypothetical protein